MKNLSLTLFFNQELLYIISACGIIFLFLFFLFRNKDKKYFFIIFLTIFYGFLSFYKLGSFKMPSTFYQVSEKKAEVVLSINDSNTDFDNIYTMAIEGISQNDNYRYQVYYHGIRIEASNDLLNWTQLAVLNVESWGKWDNIPLGKTNSYKYIRLSFPSTRSVINEIVLYNSTTNSIKTLDIYSCSDDSFNPYHLIDEQDCFNINFDYQDETYFDEIYHVRNAYEIANELNLYTAVHPLIGTRFIALGIELFGMNPFGFRFFGALVSTLLLPIIFFLAKNLLGSIFVANLASLLFTLDFMHYTTGRIATLEPFSVLFILLMYLFMIKFMKTDCYHDLKKALVFLFLSGCFMALAWATKWTGIYASIGLALCFFYKLFTNFQVSNDQNKIKKTVIIILACVIFFVLIPILVYVFSYNGIYIYDNLPSSIPDAFKQVVEYTLHIFKYHNKLESSHPYSAKWYMWLFDIRPIWYYVKYNSLNIQTISCFNNPAINLLGLYTMYFTIRKAFKNKDQTAIIITLGYLSSLLPWVFVSRTTFAYHYYPCIPFLILSIVYYFVSNKKERLLKVFLIISITLFIIYLPVISGFLSKDIYASIIRLLPSWYFG